MSISHYYISPRYTHGGYNGDPSIEQDASCASVPVGQIEPQRNQKQ